MDQIFSFPASMTWPLLACLVLTGIHVYLGVHVIARKVIFVDLALAQIAALGTVVGILLGFEVGRDSNALYLYSLAFTIFGAFIFSTTRMKGEKVPHEAIIGIVYAVTFASTILVLSRSALGPQELEHIIKGELLWVQAPTVIKTAVIYSVVGIFHFLFRKKFMAISLDPQKAEASGMNVRFWDFLFYMSFGFVITSSVAIAGVFLVFSYLVIPSVGAMLISDKLGVRLVSGWIGGAIISFVGVKLSWVTGLPTSPLIVVFFALALILSGLYRYLRQSKDRLRAVRNVLASLVVVGIFLGGLFLFRKAEEDPMDHVMHLLASPIGTDRVTGIQDLRSKVDAKSRWLPLLLERLKDTDSQVRRSAAELLGQIGEKSALAGILALLDDPSEEVRQSAINVLRVIGDTSAAARLVARAAVEPDPEIKISILATALHLGSREAVLPLIQIVHGGGIFADEAFDALRGHIQHEFKKPDWERITLWWKEHQNTLRWDTASGMFLER